MKPRFRALLASGFAVHAVELGIAAFPAAFAASFFASATGELGADVAGTDAYLEAALAAGSGRADAALLALAAAAATLVALHAPVQMAWLHALASSGGRDAVVRGLARAPRAVAVTLLVFGAGVVFAFASSCPAIAGHLILRDHANVRLHDFVVLALATPLVVVAAGVPMMHDLARAALVTPERDTLTAIGIAVRALRPRLALEYGAFLLASALTVGVAMLATLEGGSEVKAACAILVAHALLFARTLLRGAWLAHCVEATSAPDGPSRADVDRLPLDQSSLPTG